MTFEGPPSQGISFAEVPKKAPTVEELLARNRRAVAQKEYDIHRAAAQEERTTARDDALTEAAKGHLTKEMLRASEERGERQDRAREVLKEGESCYLDKLERDDKKEGTFNGQRMRLEIYVVSETRTTKLDIFHNTDDGTYGIEINGSTKPSGPEVAAKAKELFFRYLPVAIDNSGWEGDRKIQDEQNNYELELAMGEKRPGLEMEEELFRPR